MKKDINTYIQFLLDEVELNISVKEDLSGYKDFEPLYQFGYFEITNGSIKDKPLSWDNLTFFISCGKKEFKKECKEGLKEKGLDWRETYKKVKTLLKRAKKLDLL
jgi:hypothetical protein